MVVKTRRGPDTHRRKLHNIKGAAEHNDLRKSGRNAPRYKAVTRLDPPKWMSQEEREIFLHIRNHVLGLNLVTTADVIAFEALCIHYSIYINISRQLSEEGLTTMEVDNKGNERIRIHPLVRVRSESYRSLFQLLTQFGLTPNSRRTVVAADPKAAEDGDEEEWDDLLGLNDSVN